MAFASATALSGSGRRALHADAVADRGEVYGDVLLSRDDAWVGAARFELTTPGFGENRPAPGADSPPLAEVSSGSQPVEIVGDVPAPDGGSVSNVSRASRPLAGFPSPFAATLLPPAAGPAAADHDDELLSVRQVAEALRLSTATVYRICERGKLAHVRVSNAVRVSRRVLEAYMRTASQPSAQDSRRGATPEIRTRQRR